MRLELCIQNVEIMVGSETNEIIMDLFESFLQKHQEGLEESMRGSEFVIVLMYCIIILIK